MQINYEGFIKKTLFIVDQSGSKTSHVLTCLLNVQKPIFLNSFLYSWNFLHFSHSPQLMQSFQFEFLVEAGSVLYFLYLKSNLLSNIFQHGAHLNSV